MVIEPVGDVAREVLLHEPMETAVLLTVLGLLGAMSVLFSRTVDRIGIPVVLLFLVIGMLGGSEGLGGIVFEDYQLAARLGTVALILILFDGGMNSSVRALREVLWPATLLATVGVALTAALVAIGAMLMGLSWQASILLGAVVSSTDAAAVFAILRGGRLNLKRRVGTTLEVESCVNDPMAVILTLTVIQIIAEGSTTGWSLLYQVPLQLAVGAGIGVLLGWLGRWIYTRIKLSTVGLYPALTLALAFISFGLATIVQSSGFLAVFATAIVLGNGRLPYRSGLTRVHDAMAWMSQIAMFLMLGLLVNPSQLLTVTGIGLGLALFLGVVARPLAVIPCVWPFKYDWVEIAYLGWTGLRGAVPIILATFPVLAGVSGAETIFNIVFFIVVVSSIIPGSIIRPLTRLMKLDTPEKPTPSAVLDINSTVPLNGELTSFYIHPSVAVCGARLMEIDFPPGSSVLLIIRGHELVAAKGNTQLQEGDHVYVFFRHEDRPLIELLFGAEET